MSNAKTKRQRSHGTGSLFRRADGGCWIASWYDHAGKRREKSTRTTDRVAAARILTAHVEHAALRIAGVVDAKADSFAAAGRRPLAEHVEDWRQWLLDKGNTAKHTACSVACVTRVLEVCGAKHWPDLSASTVQAYIGDVRKSRSVRTANSALQAIKAFSRWMARDGRVRESPLAHLQAGNARVDVRRQRRALSADELVQLLAWTETAPTWRGMTGSARATLYQLAVETGLRANELRTLTCGSFNLDGDPPTVTVRAAYSKSRRDDTLPLKAHTAQYLDRWRDFAGSVRDTSVFAKIPDKTAEMIRRDLRRARARWIRATADQQERRARRDSEFLAVIDDGGRVVDFHALRHTFITNLARGGVHPKLAQSLARHSTITLTMDRYTHTVIGEQADALAALPDLSPRTPESELMRATGTYDSQPTHLSPQLGDKNVPRRAKACGEHAKGATLRHTQNTLQNKGDSDEMRDTATSSKDRPYRARTCDPLIKSQLLYQLS